MAGISTPRHLPPIPLPVRVVRWNDVCGDSIFAVPFLRSDYPKLGAPPNTFLPRFDPRERIREEVGRGTHPTASETLALPRPVPLKTSKKLFLSFSTSRSIAPPCPWTKIQAHSAIGLAKQVRLELPPADLSMHLYPPLRLDARRPRRPVRERVKGSMKGS